MDKKQKNTRPKNGLRKSLKKSTVSSAPFLGTTIQIIDSAGTVTLTWGLGIGVYLFIVAATIKIVAGIMLRKVNVEETE